MGNLSSALQQLRAERKQAQSRVESIDQAISVIESLNGSGTFGRANRPTRIISQASRRKMARAQRARWAKARRIAASSCDSEDNELGSCEAHDVSSGPQEDRSVPACAVGEVEGSAEEGCIVRPLGIQTNP